MGRERPGIELIAVRRHEAAGLRVDGLLEVALDLQREEATWPETELLTVDVQREIAASAIVPRRVLAGFASGRS